MIKRVAASSLYPSTKKLKPSEQEKLSDIVNSFPGLNLDPNTSNYCYDYLTLATLRNRNIILWHDLLNKTLTSHPRNKNTPQTVDELIKTLKTIPNFFCVVTCQRQGAPYIFDKLVKALKCYVIDVTKHIICASEQTDELVLAEYRELHQHPDVELRSLASVHQANLQDTWYEATIGWWTVSQTKKTLDQVGVLIESLALSPY